MTRTEPSDPGSASFDLPHNIVPWLRAVTVFGFISLIASVSLLLIIGYKLITWQIRSKRSNQFVILIFNLLLADTQQAIAFLLNVEWLRVGSVEVESSICFAQGWFVSTGDLGSGVWCFAIGLHTFASVIMDYRLPSRYFGLAIAMMWTFVYAISCIGVGMHGDKLFVRSGVWCWIDHHYGSLRLYTHYLWIFIFEFGNVIIYACIYTILIHRIKCGFYTTEAAKRVRSISNLMVVYPLVYVVCTLPLASARMATMSGNPPSYTRLCLAGAMITSNGWLDVLLYTCTRKIMIFSDEPPTENDGVDTFSAFWADKPDRFGGECTVEALQSLPKSRYGRCKGSSPSRSESCDDLCGFSKTDIKLVTTTQVTSEPAGPEDYEAMGTEARQKRPRSPVGRWSQDTLGSRSLNAKDYSNTPSPQLS